MTTKLIQNLSKKWTQVHLLRQKPVENPVHVVKCFGGLNVIGCQKIDGKSNGEPDDVWAEEEEGARDKGSHPAWPAAGTISKKCKLL